MKLFNCFKPADFQASYMMHNDWMSKGKEWRKKSAPLYNNEFIFISLPIDKCTNRKFNKSANYSQHCLIRIMLTLKFSNWIEILLRRKFLLIALYNGNDKPQHSFTYFMSLHRSVNEWGKKKVTDTQPEKERANEWIYSLDYRVIVHIQLYYWMIFILYYLVITILQSLKMRIKNRFKQFFAVGWLVACLNRKKKHT